MRNNNVNNKTLIEELELELEISREVKEHPLETCWDKQIGILLSRHTVEQIVNNLKKIEFIINQ